jgi:hypothetical protein
MEVRATTELARILSRDLGDKRQAQKRLEALFDVYQVSNSIYIVLPAVTLVPLSAPQQLLQQCYLYQRYGVVCSTVHPARR